MWFFFSLSENIYIYDLDYSSRIRAAFRGSFILRYVKRRTLFIVSNNDHVGIYNRRIFFFDINKRSSLSECFHLNKRRNARLFAWLYCFVFLCVDNDLIINYHFHILVKERIFSRLILHLNRRKQMRVWVKWVDKHWDSSSSISCVVIFKRTFSFVNDDRNPVIRF